MTHLTPTELGLCLASWGQYVLGMAIYAANWPKLSPRHFSSHEVRQRRKRVSDGYSSGGTSSINRCTMQHTGAKGNS